MNLIQVFTSIIEIFGPVVVCYIFSVILIDIVVRAFTGGY